MGPEIGLGGGVGGALWVWPTVGLELGLGASCPACFGGPARGYRRGRRLGCWGVCRACLGHPIRGLIDESQTGLSADAATGAVEGVSEVLGWMLQGVGRAVADRRQTTLSRAFNLECG